MSQEAKAPIMMNITVIVQVIMRRFLLQGFLIFFGLVFLGSSSGFDIGSSDTLNLPVSLSKLKAWTGLRKSAVMSALVLGEVLGAVLETGGLTGFGVALGGVFLAAGLTVGLMAGLMGFGTEAFLARGAVFMGGWLEDGTVLLERRVLNPSIDLFLSIEYNYSIWRLS